MRRCNLFTAELGPDEKSHGFRSRSTRVATDIGASRIGGQLIELDAGERACPYHYHWANEERLFVIDGAPTLRTPDGTRELRRGDVVCFPIGPGGVHSITGPGRYLIVSTMRAPDIPAYPDSDKIGTTPTRTYPGPDRFNFVRSTAVDYYHGEGE